jgi:CheY-like chemotaxis protein
MSRIMKYPETIMIIDEDREDTEIFCDAVHELNPQIQCIEVPEGIKALKTLSKDPVKPEFIFVDLNMTLINGRKWLSQVKKTEGLQDIPVVIYSASKSQMDIQDARNKGATFYLPKQSRVSELKKMLSKLFLKKQTNFLIGS